MLLPRLQDMNQDHFNDFVRTLGNTPRNGKGIISLFLPIGTGDRLRKKLPLGFRIL